MNNEQSVKDATTWLREEPTLMAARIAYLLRERGIDTRTCVCVKIFPDFLEPTGGAVITSQRVIWQFAFNTTGTLIELSQIEQMVNITSTVLDHPWRDDILAGLRL